MRPNGERDVEYVSSGLSMTPAVCTPSVSTNPGRMAFTRILRGPSSLVVYLSAADHCLAPTTGSNAPLSSHWAGVCAMRPPQLYDQRVVLGRLWRFVRRPLAWPGR